LSAASGSVVYGVDPLGNSFCFGNPARVTGWSAELLDIKACTTYGQLRALQPRLRMAWIPCDLEERADEGFSDTDSWSWHQEVAESDGDWPPSPLCLGLDMCNEAGPLWGHLESIVGCEVWTTLDGDQLHIPVDKEQDLLRAFRLAGLAPTRDDASFAAFA
jgi:hypothetical protein